MGRGMRIVIAVVVAFAVSVFSTRGTWPLGGVLLAAVAGFVVWVLLGSITRSPARRAAASVPAPEAGCVCPPDALHCTCQEQD